MGWADPSPDRRRRGYRSDPEREEDPLGGAWGESRAGPGVDTGEGDSGGHGEVPVGEEEQDLAHETDPDGQRHGGRRLAVAQGRPPPRGAPGGGAGRTRPIPPPRGRVSTR